MRDFLVFGIFKGDLRESFKKTGDVLYRFDLPVRLCLKIPVTPAESVIPAKAGISPIYRFTRWDFRLCGTDRLRGTDGVNGNANKKFALKTNREKTEIFKSNRYNLTDKEVRYGFASGQ